MHYLATIVSGETEQAMTPGTPEFGAGLAKYAQFQEQAGAAIAGGAALYPSATAINVQRMGDETLVTDGPFTELNEVVTGFYVLDCQSMDEAVELAGKIPAASKGSVEVRPMVMWMPHSTPGADWWTALLWSPQGELFAPESAEWQSMAVAHQQFAERVGAAIKAGGALHPPETARIVRERDGRLLLTDGPYIEGAEVIDGLYVFTAANAAQATEIVRQIPRGEKGRTELRQIVDVGF
ncbi:YciI family protein [Nocardia altamirensis]|uniref:YciI family protein n=1 Tax=Nocardia altamirensis TaxID=472158 RepID=UPI0008405C61|nr:YciI family protein [Nocardia altamirensis]